MLKYMQITSRQGQWLGDIAVRESGSIEAIIEMSIANEIAVTEVLAAGTPLAAPTPIDRRVLNYYRTNGINPATVTTLEQKTFGGIGFMAVGISFIVS